MDYLLSIIFGAVQGLTEFLPISSSGHLVILHQIFPVSIFNSLGFDVALHIGTLLALIIYFFRDLAKYISAFFRSFASWEYQTNSDQRLAWLLIVSIIPAGLAAIIFSEAIETTLRSPIIVASMLIIGGLLFFLVEWLSRQNIQLNQIGFGRAILVAIAQALALIPGVSRSGVTITAGMAMNLDRESATRFSFLMAIPIIFLAGAKKLYDLAGVGLNSQEVIMYVLGTIAALIFGLLAIRLFLQFVKKFSLVSFGVYRIILAVAVLFFLA